MEEQLLDIYDLKTYFYTNEGIVQAVDGIDFSIKKGQTMGIVGESGCGKSVTSLSILRLIPEPPGKIVEGQIIFKNKNLLEQSEAVMQQIRGKEISMIFQEPMVALNPVFTVGNQISETIILHEKLSKKEAREKTIEMLDLVGIPSPEDRIDDYPHQLSGGMQQRVMIAMALACNPQLLIADEPTTALDVTIEAQILELMSNLQQELETAILLITHDLGVVAETCEKVAVMYLGKIMEQSSVKELFANPVHPYTRGLLASIPKLNEKKKEFLYAIKGNVPSPVNLENKCRFYSRCDYRIEKCAGKEPPLTETGPDHWVRCWREGDF